MVKKNTWVQIEKVILEPINRQQGIPEDTSNTPLIIWVKGHLLDDSKLGEIVSIKTKTGRTEIGKLVEVNPSFNHSFGNYVPEIEKIDEIIKSTLYGEDHE